MLSYKHNGNAPHRRTAPVPNSGDDTKVKQHATRPTVISSEARPPAVRPSVSGKVVQFVYEKETPGAVRYMEIDESGNARTTDGEGGVIGFVYLRKAALRQMFGSNHIPSVVTIQVAME